MCDEKRKSNVLRLLGNKFLSNVPSSWWNWLLVFDKSRMQMFRLTCFLGEGLNHLTGRPTPGTIARPDVHRVLGVRQEVLQPGWVLLAVDLNSVCSCFFVMSWPVPNLQTFKLSNSLSWCRHLNCEKFFSADSVTIDANHYIVKYFLVLFTFLAVLDHSKAYNADD